VLASLGIIVLLIAKVQEGSCLGIGFQNHIATFASIATIRTAAGDVFLAPEAYTPIPPIPGFDEDFCLIDEFDCLNSPDFFVGIAGFLK